MSALAMFSVATAIAIFHISNINGMEQSDIGNILGQLQKTGFSLQRSHLLVDQSLDSESSTDYIQQLTENVARSPQVQLEYPYKDKDLFYDKNPRNKHGRYSIWPWRQTLYVKPAWLKSVYTPRTQSYPVNERKEDENNDLGDYSKVYLVLDSNADITESDLKDLSNKVASLFTKSRTPEKSRHKDHLKKEQRYKGFVIKDIRRRTRESNEKFAEGDSTEREFKPKRVRVDYGGGRGRTPIPYIRHRGDIYERD